MGRAKRGKIGKHWLAAEGAARLEAGLDQEQVAKLLDKMQSHVSKVEAGQRRIDIVSLKEFARIYKKPLDYYKKLLAPDAVVIDVWNVFGRKSVVFRV